MGLAQLVRCFAKVKVRNLGRDRISYIITFSHIPLQVQFYLSDLSDDDQTSYLLSDYVVHSHD